MGEADSFALDLKDAAPNGWLEGRGRVRGVEDRQPRIRERSDQRQRVASFGREELETLPYEVAQMGRQRQAVGRQVGEATPHERPSKLEAEKRVAAGLGMDPRDHVARQRVAQAVGDDPPHCSEAEGPDFDPAKLSGSFRTCDVEGKADSRSPGKQESDPRRLETSRRVLDGACRRPIGPLNVVDRDQHGVRFSEGSQDRQKANRDRIRMRALTFGRSQHEGHLDGLALRQRQRRQHPVWKVREQVAQDREREGRFGFAGPAGPDLEARLPPGLDAGLPEPGLADARRPFDHELPDLRLNPVQESVDRR